MNTIYQSAVAGSTTTRHPCKTRSKYAYLFDLTDEKERHVCRCLSDFHRGKGYVAVELRRAVQTFDEKPHRVIMELVELAPSLRDRGRWTVITWGIDRPAVSFDYRSTKKAALAILRSATAR